MTLDALNALVGERVDSYDGPGLVLGIGSVHPPFLRVRSDGDGLVRRIAAHTLTQPSTTDRRPVMAATATPAANAEKSAPKKSAPKKAPKKSKLAVAMEGTDAELAEFLLAHITYPDTAWADRAGKKSRRKDESRSDFIRRALGVEEDSGEEGST